MKWTKQHAGSLFTLPAVMFLYCLPGIAHAVPVAAPKILTISVQSGNQLKLSCQVDPRFLKDETLVYWLVNNSFVETAFPNGTVQMSTIEGVKFIHSDLIFQSAEDIRDNRFTCVAMNPAGMDTKTIEGKLPVQRMCNNRNRRPKRINFKN